VGVHRRAKPLYLAAKLFMIREYLEVSQGQMARLVKLKQGGARISEYESGIREPNLLVLLSYARSVGLSADVLIDDSLHLSEQLFGRE